MAFHFNVLVDHRQYQPGAIANSDQCHNDNLHGNVAHKNKFRPASWNNRGNHIAHSRVVYVDRWSSNGANDISTVYARAIPDTASV